jgi:hypothetical protein
VLILARASAEAVSPLAVRAFAIAPPSGHGRSVDRAGARQCQAARGVFLAETLTKSV